MILRNKSYIGLKIVGEHIKLLRMVPSGRKYIVDAAGTIDISELLNEAAEEQQNDDGDTGTFGFEEDELADLKDDKPTGGSKAKGKDRDKEKGGNSLEDELEDESWMEGDDDEHKHQDVKSRIIYELQEILHELGGKNVDLALVISSGSTTFQKVEKPPALKNVKKQKELIRERLEETLAITNLQENEFRWMVRDDSTILVASYQEASVLLDLYECLNVAQPHTYFLRAFLPEEIVLMQFLDEPLLKKGETNQQGSTVLINMGKEGTRIIFVQDGLVQAAMPVIAMKKPGPSYVNKVFSRIIMELEKGQVSFIRAFKIHDEVGLGDSLSELLSSNFEGIEAQLIEPDQNFEIDDSLDFTWADVDISLLGAAVIASGKESKVAQTFSFIPQRIYDRQKVFKLKWHGVLLLLLIALSPIVINHLYNDISSANSDMQVIVDRQARQITELEDIKRSVDILDEQNALMSVQFDQINDLSKRSRMWTETLGILNRGMPQIQNSWITSLQFTNDRLMMEGTSMYRQRIPLVAELFHSAGIQQVSQTQIRETEFFNFIIVVDKITADDSLFDPQVDLESLRNGGAE